MTCREHWWELWRRPHQWMPWPIMPDGAVDVLNCGACGRRRITKRRNT